MQTDSSVTHATDRPDGGGNRGRPARGRRTVVAVAVTVVAGVAAALGFALATDDGTERSQTTTSLAPPATAPAATEPDAAGGAATTAPPATSPVGEPVLEDGRHPVYLTGLDVAGAAVEFDLIQFLTGDAAIAAWDQAHPDDPGGPPNDYFIVNDNPRLRELPVAATVQVTVLDWDGGFTPQVVAFADLPTQLASDLVPGDDRLWPNPFWLTVEDETITAIEEQYIP